MFVIFVVLLVVDTGGGDKDKTLCFSDISNLRRDMKSVANYNVTE